VAPLKEVIVTSDYNGRVRRPGYEATYILIESRPWQTLSTFASWQPTCKGLYIAS